jgi:hypothetical protein
MSRIGFNTYERIKRLEITANRLGFRLTGLGIRDNDIFILKPIDEDTLPIFPKDQSLFGGDLEQVESFLHGIEWARDYDLRIGLRTAKSRPKAEQQIRNQRLLKLMKGTANGQKQNYPF